jgi:hypothetical protein
MHRNVLPIGFMLMAAGLCFGVVLTSDTLCLAEASSCYASEGLSAFEYFQVVYALGD